MTLTAIIDADPIVYSCGFACEKHKYYLTVAGEETPRATFDYKTEMNRWVEENIPEEEWSYEDEVIVEPLANVLNTVKKRVEAILKHTGSTDKRLFLTGGNQFRFEIYPEYKANRKDRKPTHYKEIRQYLIDHHGAVVMERYEADDACATAQVTDPNPTILCSIDKDLLQVPGRHYNYDTGMEHWVNDYGFLTYKKERCNGCGMKFFYAQMLMGDKTDNIKGIPGCGDKGAYDSLQHTTTKAEGVEVVKRLYKNAFRENWKKQLKLNRDLLWMVRNVPGI